MARLTHLTLASNRNKILRSGIRATKSRRLGAGIYAMPVIPDFYASHQWLRELRRRSGAPLVAVDFVIPDDERVLVGRYAAEKEEMTAVQAAGLIMHATERRGYEVFVPRTITKAEVDRFRTVPQVIGWRYMPGAHGSAPCTCPACAQPGTYGAAKLRAHFPSR